MDLIKEKGRTVLLLWASSKTAGENPMVSVDGKGAVRETGFPFVGINVGASGVENLR